MTDEYVLNLTNQAKLEIPVRFTGGTYMARFRNQTASCTEGAAGAVRAVLRKVIGAEAVNRLAFNVTSYATPLYTVSVTTAPQP